MAFKFLRLLAIILLVSGIGCGGDQDGDETSPPEFKRGKKKAEPIYVSPKIGEYRVIPGGLTFSMGTSSLSAPTPSLWDPLLEVQHIVTITYDLAVALTEVTQGEFRKVMGGGSYNSTFYDYPVGDSYPMHNLSIWSMMVYANGLSRIKGLNHCYDFKSWTSCSGRAADGNLVCHGYPLAGKAAQDFLKCDGYRLPTEAEWEFFARALSQTHFFFGDADTELDKYASVKNMSPVGSKLPNSWGIYDVYGNVSEMVQDTLRFFSPVAVTDPFSPLGGALQVVRGGGVIDQPGYMRSAARDSMMFTNSRATVGFRLVRKYSGIGGSNPIATPGPRVKPQPPPVQTPVPNPLPKPGGKTKDPKRPKYDDDF